MTTQTPQSKASEKDELRDAIFSEKSFQRCKATLFGQKIELRQAPIGWFLRVQKKLQENTGEAYAEMLIKFCYVKGTNEQIFSEDDKAKLLDLPFNDSIQDLIKSMNKLMGVSDEDVEQAVKNSVKTTSDGTSS